MNPCINNHPCFGGTDRRRMNLPFNHKNQRTPVHRFQYIVFPPVKNEEWFSSFPRKDRKDRKLPMRQKGCDMLQRFIRNKCRFLCEIRRGSAEHPCLFHKIHAGDRTAVIQNIHLFLTAEITGRRFRPVEHSFRQRHGQSRNTKQRYTEYARRKRT